MTCGTVFICTFYVCTCMRAIIPSLHTCTNLLQVRGHKLMVRWLLGLNNDQEQYAIPVLKLFDCTLANDGDLNGDDNVRQKLTRKYSVFSNIVFSLSVCVSLYTPFIPSYCIILESESWSSLLLLSQNSQTHHTVQNNCVQYSTYTCHCTNQPIHFYLKRN